MVRIVLLILVGSILICGTMSCETKKPAVDNNALRKLDEQLKAIRTEKDPALVKKIEDIVNKIDNTDFKWTGIGGISKDSVDRLLLAEEPGLVKLYLLKVDDVKFLIENAEISLPLIYELLVNKEWNWTEPQLCVYFTVFDQTKNPDSLPYLIDYLRKVPPVRDMFISKEPFYPAVEAVLAFTGPTKEIPFEVVFEGTVCFRLFDKTSAYNNRLKLADDAQKWYNNYKNKK